MQEIEVGVAKTIHDILKGHFLFGHASRTLYTDVHALYSFFGFDGTTKAVRLALLASDPCL